MGLFGEVQKQMKVSEYMENIELEGLDSKAINRIKESVFLIEDKRIEIYQNQNDKATNLFLCTLIEQNWLLMKKLDSIDKSLKELNSK